MRGHWVMLLGLWACGAEDPVEDEEPKGPTSACGDITEWDVRMTGLVHRDGAPAAGAQVTLEETHWHPGGETFATGVTDADGVFVLDAEGIVAVEGCWGTAISYVVRAELDGLVAERGVNQRLYAAIYEGSGESDLSTFPLELQ